MDLYTQYENIKKYEELTGKKITKEYDVDNAGKLVMCDIRSLLSYKKTFKDITNLIGICRTIELDKQLKIKDNIKL